MDLKKVNPTIELLGTFTGFIYDIRIAYWRDQYFHVHFFPSGKSLGRCSQEK